MNYGLCENGEWLPINRPRFHKQVKGNSEMGYLHLNDNSQSRSGNPETEAFDKKRRLLIKLVAQFPQLKLTETLQTPDI